MDAITRVMAYLVQFLVFDLRSLVLDFVRPHSSEFKGNPKTQDQKPKTVFLVPPRHQ